MKRLKSTTNINTKVNKLFSAEIVDQKKLLIEVENSGLSLYGINIGDIAVVTFSEDFSEKHLSAFHILTADRETGSLVFGFGYDNFGEIGIKDRNIERHKVKNVRYLGFVSAVIKSYEPPQVWEHSKSEKKAETAEISVKCADCGKEATGSREFLQAMAWQLKKAGTLCVSCW